MTQEQKRRPENTKTVGGKLKEALETKELCDQGLKRQKIDKQYL